MSRDEYTKYVEDLQADGENETVEMRNFTVDEEMYKRVERVIRNGNSSKAMVTDGLPI